MRTAPLRAAAVAASLLALVGPIGPGEVGAATRIVRMGVYQNEPKVFVDGNGEPAGIFVDIFSEVAREEGWAPIYVPCHWAQCLESLQAGRIDLMPDVAWSRERARSFSFNLTPVLESWSQLYASSDGSIRTVADLEGKRVAVLGGAIQQATFERMMAGFGYTVTIVQTTSMEEAFAAVRDGDADVAIANHFFGEHFYAQYGLVHTPVVFGVSQLHFATAKGENRDLLTAIDRWVVQWRSEPSSPYYAALGRWMDRPPRTVVPGRILWIVAAALGLLALAVGVILMLRAQVRARTRHLQQANDELRQADAALRENAELLRSVERLSRIGGWRWTVATGSASWTEETWRIHGLDPDEAGPVTPDLVEASLACFDPTVREELGDAFRRCVEEGIPYDLELPFTSRAGARLWVRTTATPILDPRGAVVEVLGNIMDVTARKEAELERQRVEEQLRQSQKMEAVGKLAGGIAHDFNNHLTVILSYAEMGLPYAREGELVHKALTRILDAGRRSAALTKQLLAFGRKQALALAPVDLNRTATGLDGMLRRVLGEDIEVRLRLDPALGSTLADAGQLDQVLMNLVINARDAMPTGGVLTIETANADVDEAAAAREVGATAGPHVVLSVSDTGTGMDEATRARIFEPYFTTKEAGRGTGLGLAIVFGIVSQCGGHLRVRSAPGEGSTFAVFLPRDLSVGAPQVVEAPAREHASGTGTILVAEDEGAVRALVVEALGAAGYTVIATAGGDEAVEAASRHQGPIDLLLTDVVMPGMSGTSLAEQVTAQRPATRVLYMSGYTDSAILRHGLIEGTVRLVPKPFTIAQLTRAVRDALDDAPADPQPRGAAASGA